MLDPLQGVIPFRQEVLISDRMKLGKTNPVAGRWDNPITRNPYSSTNETKLNSVPIELMVDKQQRVVFRRH